MIFTKRFQQDNWMNASQHNKLLLYRSRLGWKSAVYRGYILYVLSVLLARPTPTLSAVASSLTSSRSNASIYTTVCTSPLSVVRAVLLEKPLTVCTNEHTYGNPSTRSEIQCLSFFRWFVGCCRRGCSVVFDLQVKRQGKEAQDVLEKQRPLTFLLSLTPTTERYSFLHSLNNRDREVGVWFWIYFVLGLRDLCKNTIPTQESALRNYFQVQGLSQARNYRRANKQKIGKDESQWRSLQGDGGIFGDFPHAFWLASLGNIWFEWWSGLVWSFIRNVSFLA